MTDDRDYIIDDLNRLMVRIGANERWYEQEWLGVPIWQLPGDLVRLQQVVHHVRPQWIVETGTKFGGSAIFFASLLALAGRSEDDGGVITADLFPTETATRTFAEHPLRGRVKAFIHGDAAADETIARVSDMVAGATGPILVILDDNHNADHVSREIAGYGPLVTTGSYLIVADTVFEDLAGTPVGRPTEKYPDVARSNPRRAVDAFLGQTTSFERDRRFVGRGPGNFNDGFLLKVS